MRRLGRIGPAIALAACAFALPSGASAQTPSTCASPSKPALRLVVDTNQGTDSRRAVSVGNASGTAAAAMFPVNLIVTRNGSTRTVLLRDLQGEYRYRARRGERAGFAATYAEDMSGYGGIVFGSQLSRLVDLGALTTQLNTLLGTLQLPTLQVPQITVLLPVLNTPGSFAGAFCTRALAASVTEGATASRSSRKAKRRVRVRRAH